MKKKKKVALSGQVFPLLTAQEGAKVYAQLRRDVTDRGILDREYRYYTILTIIILAGFGASLVGIIFFKHPAALIFTGLLFAFFAVQIGGLLHDAGHRAIFKSAKINDVFGHICGFLLADAYSFWKLKHNMHHAHTNQVDEDPDIDLPFLSFTPERYAAKKGFLKWLSKFQAYLYFPLGILVVFSPRLGSIQYLRDNIKKQLWWEILLFSVAFFIWFIAPFLVFDLSKALVLFAVVHTAMGFYFLNVFAPNHKGMPEIEKGMKLSFIEQQVMTSRNIHAHWLTDFLYLGLNYQIEHHLFPNCPRNKLHRITPLVRKLCKERNLEYTAVSYIETNKIILSELNRIAKTSA